MPLVSVIIPIYNVGEYLSECLSSVVNQTLRDIEIICINDGSTDNSDAILDEYARKDPRIIVINQKNKGQANARNAGLKISKGKYIVFVDGDDWINSEMLATLVLLIVQDVDAIIFGVNIFGEQDESTQKYFRMKFLGKLDLSGDIISNCPVPPWNKIYRKDLIVRYKISFPEGLLYEDNSFHWKYLMQARRVIFVREKFYNYRGREGSVMFISKLRSPCANDHLLVYLEIFEYMKRYDFVKKYFHSFIRFFEHCLEVVCIYTDDLQKSMKIAGDIWNKIDINTNNDIICALKLKNYDYVYKWIGYSFLEKIFSIKKRYGRKVITICWIQIPR